MKKIALFLIMMIIFMSCAKAVQSESFNYKKLLGKWEIINSDNNFKGMKFFYIYYDKKRNCLFINAFGNSKNPLFYDSISKTLRYRIVGKGPIGDLEEFKILDKKLVHYYFSGDKWIKGKEYKKVN